MILFLRLYFEFFKTGLFSIGGGMATIPFLKEIAAATGWFTTTDLTNMIAVSESTPGPIGVNMATYVGYVTGMEQGGTPTAILGAIVATLGLITPSIIVILIIAGFLKSFRDSKYVNNAFYGLRPASTGLIAAAGFGVISTTLFAPTILDHGVDLTKIAGDVNWIGVGLALFLWIFTNKVKATKKWHPIIFIGFSAVIGILFQMG